jgi:uncharacterized membrane protein YfcA
MTFTDILILAGISAVSFVLSFFGAAVGLILGHLRLPLLVYYLDSPTAGASTNLAVSGLGALAGTYRHAREGRVSLYVLALMGIPSAIGAALSVLFFIEIERFWAHLVIGTVLTVTGFNLIRARPPEGTERLEMPTGLRMLSEIIIGLLLGALAAVTGLMLGSLRLPMMIRLLKIDPRVAVGSNMAVGFLTAAVGATTSWLAGGGLHLVTLAIVAPATILGGHFGAHLTGRFRKETLQRLVGWTIAITGIVMIGQAFWKMLRTRDFEPLPQQAQVQRVVPRQGFPA